MNQLPGLYFGTIINVLYPNHNRNYSKYQTEYIVTITVDYYSTLVVTAIKADSSGNYDNYEDEQLQPNDKVYVMFPRGDRAMGVIMGCIRSYHEPQDPAEGYYYSKRYNRITTDIDKLGNWSVTSDEGPNAQVNTNSVILDDSVGEKITLDRDAKTLTIDAGTWKVNVTGAATIDVKGNTTINVGGTANIKIEGAATVKAASLDANIEGQAKIKCKTLNAEAAGQAKIKAATISLNGEMGQVITTSTMPTWDLITGIPSVGVPNVKAGGGV
jgi:hypothetical protein